MPEENEEEIIDNVLRVLEEAPGSTADNPDYDILLADLGFNREGLLQLAFAINKDDYFKPLGVGLIPDDVADCVTVGELVELVKNELNNENVPTRRRRPGK